MYIPGIYTCVYTTIYIVYKYFIGSSTLPYMHAHIRKHFRKCVFIYKSFRKCVSIYGSASVDVCAYMEALS